MCWREVKAEGKLRESIRGVRWGLKFDQRHRGSVSLKNAISFSSTGLDSLWVVQNSRSRCRICPHGVQSPDPEKQNLSLPSNLHVHRGEERCLHEEILDVSAVVPDGLRCRLTWRACWTQSRNHLGPPRPCHILFSLLYAPHHQKEQGPAQGTHVYMTTLRPRVSSP